jgi:hypothetical protein
MTPWSEFSSREVHPLVVWRRTPTNNELLGLHWRARMRLRDEWYYLVKVAAQEFEIPKQGPAERRSLRIVSYRLQLADEDNLKGGVKPVIDALKNGGFILDDDPQAISQEVEQIQIHRRKDERTLIYIRIPDPMGPDNLTKEVRK